MILAIFWHLDHAEDINEATSFSAYGWGAIAEGQVTRTPLQVAKVGFIDHQICSTSDFYGQFVDSSGMICAGFVQKQS